MIRPLNRARNVLVAADRIREAHSLGDRRIRWPELRVILANEGIRVRRYAMKPRAYIAGWSGHFVIALRDTIELSTAVKLLLHEYAHAKLHLADRNEPTRQLVTCTKDDPREDEANLLAALLWHGPSATPDHPAIAKLVAKLEAGEHRQRLPRQLPLELPEPMPRMLSAADLDWEDEIHQRRGKNRKRAQLPDAKRVKLAGPGYPFTARFVDRTGMVWTIYDRGDRRGFYHSHLVRSVYQFSRGEVRTLTAARLDRQLREAKPLRPHHVNTVSTSRTRTP